MSKIILDYLAENLRQVWDRSSLKTTHSDNVGGTTHTKAGEDLRYNF